LKKDRFAMLKEHLKVLELTMWIPRYLYIISIFIRQKLVA